MANATLVDASIAKNTLNSMLTDYDRRVSKRESIPNIYRMSHLLGVSGNVFDTLEGMVSVDDIISRIDQFFIVSDLPPAKRFIELLKNQPETPTSNVYLAGWPKGRK